MEQKTIKIKQEESRLFLDSSACKIACEKLVKEAVKHFEMQVIEEQAIWDGLKEKYKLDFMKYDYQIDHTSLEMIEIPKEYAGVKEYLNKGATRKAIKANIRKKLGLKDSK